MTVTLTKNITLQSASVYFSLERKVERKDIQEYLSGNKFQNDIIEERIKDYLKDIKIYDEQYHLTPYGKSVQESGKVKIREEGKYQIWYTRNDNFFDNKIFYFERIQPRKDKQNIERLSLNLTKEEHFHLPVSGSRQPEFFRFKVPSQNNGFSNNDFSGQQIKKNCTIKLTWKWNELESSEYIFDGLINSLKINSEYKIPSDKNLKEFILKILPKWNSNTQRYKIRFNVIEKDEHKLSLFEYHYYKDSWENFEVGIEKLPVEPYNLEEARVWRNKLLTMELEKNYMHPDDFSSNVISINQKDGFMAYADQLDIPDINQYIHGELEHGKKSDRGAAFWHTRGPLDLYPGIPQVHISDKFELHKEWEISFQEIVEKMGITTAEKIFYYDRYIIEKPQQQKAAAFLNAFACTTKYLITDTAKQKDTILQDSGIIQKNLTEIFVKNRSQHDRHVVIDANGALIIWHISNSMDYISFNEDTISSDTKGKIVQSAIFNKVNQDMLHHELRSFIQQELKNG